MNGSEKLKSTHSRTSSGGSYGVGGRVIFASVTIMALVAGAGGWASTAELAGAVVSPGVVVVDHYVKQVQHREGGTIARINVKNGDRVEIGDTLLSLDATQTRSELAIIVSQLMELRARVARLNAERDQAEHITFPESVLAWAGGEETITGEKRLFEENRKTRNAQKQQLSQRIGQLNNEAEGYAIQRDAKGTELALIQRELDKVRELVNKGLTPATRVYSLERDQARLAGEHGNLISQGARVLGQIEELKMQIFSIDQTARADAQKELRATEPRIAELLERQIASDDKLAHLDIKAPASGIVHELATHTVGGVVNPAAPIMMIVPEQETLSVEVKVAPSDIDRVYIGQDAHLRFTSFNQRTTPEGVGQISYISADVSHDPKGRQDYYTARIPLSPNIASELGGKTIVPGMPVETFITTDKRTALSFFMKPVTDQFTRTFRER